MTSTPVVRLAALVVLALVASLSLAAPSTAAVPNTPHATRTQAAGDLAAARERILEKTNAYRDAEGLPALAGLKGMHQVSQRWSAKMAKAGQMTHNPAYASQIPPGWSAAGENVAAGYAVGKVVRAWWNSPGHRANMLGDYTHIGIGYAVARDGTPYYTQNFARY